MHETPRPSLQKKSWQAFMVKEKQEKPASNFSLLSKKVQFQKTPPRPQ